MQSSAVATATRALKARAKPQDLAAVLDKLEGYVRDVFLSVVSGIQDELVKADLAALIERGRLADAMKLATQFDRVADAIVEADLAGAEAAAAKLRRDIGGTLSFDRTRQRYAARIMSRRLNLITAMRDAQREAIGEVLMDGMKRGINPVQMAREFRGSIGLTARMEEAARNYRRALEARSPEALARQLRDRRFDGTVRRAIREQKPIPRKKIDTMVQRYRERALKRRAETIARTEVLRAIHEGQEETLLQMIESGRIDPATVARVWHTRMDGRQRDHHGSMSGQKRALGEAFESGEGNRLAYPGDPDAPGSETINCRCTLSFSAEPVTGQSAAPPREEPPPPPPTTKPKPKPKPKPKLKPPRPPKQPAAGMPALRPGSRFVGRGGEHTVISVDDKKIMLEDAQGHRWAATRRPNGRYVARGIGQNDASGWVA